MKCVYCAVRTVHLTTIQANLTIWAAVTQLTLVVGLSPRRSGFDHRSVHMRYVRDTMALGQIYLPGLRMYPVSIIPPLLNTNLHLYVSLA